MAEETTNSGTTSNVKRIVLILLTIFTLGPLIFVGTCFPSGIVLSTMGSIGFFLAFAIGIFLAVFVCSRIIKNIK